MNEFEIIRRFFTRTPANAVQGVGDDCARVRVGQGMELAITTDMLIEDRHFLSGADPRALGHKCLAVNLSDLAAAGARPRWAMLAIALPEADEAWLAAFSCGFFALAGRHGVDLIGGDTTRGPLLTIAITAFGEVPAGQALTRAGARPGDDLWLSGEVGGAALALVHPGIVQAATRLHEPQPRVELGQALRGIASAAIDVSDGLAGDLAHILERSQVGALVQYNRIPRDVSFAKIDNPELERQCLLSGGDDYELLFSAPKEKRKAVEKLGGVSRIGEIFAGSALEIVGADGKLIPHGGGFDHFGARA